MTPTLTRGLRQRNVDTDQLTYWANKELIPLVAQVVQALNYVSRVQAEITTAGTAAFTTIWSSEDLALRTVVRFDAQITGAEIGQQSIFTITGLFVNDGTVHQEGATVNGPTVNASGYAVRYFVVGNHIDVQVADAGASTNWLATIDAQVLTA